MFVFASINKLGLFSLAHIGPGGFRWGSGIWVTLPHRKTFPGVVYGAWSTVALGPHGPGRSHRDTPATKTTWPEPTGCCEMVGPTGRAAAMGAVALLSEMRRVYLDMPSCSAKQHCMTPSCSATHRRQQLSCQKPSSC